MVPELVIELVEELKHKHPVKLILEVLNVPKSNYYRWKNKEQTEDTTVKKVKELCEDNHYTYGYHKITALMNQASKQPINHKCVQRIMRENDLNCRVRIKKSKCPGKAYYLTSQ